MNNTLPVKIEQCELSQNSATFSPNIGWSEWLEAGRKLCKVFGATNWWLGDWLNFGEKAYGEKYAQALLIVDLDEQTLRNYAWVAASVNVSSRRQCLTWTHHREVAHMKPDAQAKWLNDAATGHWSVSELRQQIRRHEAVYIEDDSEPNPKLFKLATEAMQLGNKLREEIKREPVTTWTPERKQQWRDLLKPVHDVYEQLANTKEAA